MVLTTPSIPRTAIHEYDLIRILTQKGSNIKNKKYPLNLLFEWAIKYADGYPRRKQNSVENKEIFKVLNKTFEYKVLEKNFSKCFKVNSGSKKLDFNNSKIGKIIIIIVSSSAGKIKRYSFFILKLSHTQ